MAGKEVSVKISIKDLTIEWSGEPAAIEAVQNALGQALLATPKTTLVKAPGAKRGRKKAVPAQESITATVGTPETPAVPKKRGRPRKNQSTEPPAKPVKVKKTRAPKKEKKTKAKATKAPKTPKATEGTKGRPGRPMGLRPGSCAYQVTQLIEHGFFDQGRVLTEVVNELALQGFPFKQENVSPVLLTLTNRRALARVKNEEGSWVYSKG